MLSADNNRLLTEVGAGTPMGDYLRRYWMPIGGATELDRIAIKPMRLLAEDLVLYRDRGGTFGLIDRRCPHRRADLTFGYVEDTTKSAAARAPIRCARPAGCCGLIWGRSLCPSCRSGSR